ncbi:MAG: hypothetical protein ABEJ65_00145 [bacterium]
MNLEKEALNWLLKASLWVSSEESMGDSFEALSKAKEGMLDDESDLLESSKIDRSTAYRLIESIVWSSKASQTENLASNLVEIFQGLTPSQFVLNGQKRLFESSLYDIDVDPHRELSDFWDIRLESAQARGASSAFHNLLDYCLKTVEMGVHPLEPDPVSFVVGDFSEDFEFENPNITFPIEVLHRSARATFGSDQFISINEKVVWVDDSSGRMGVVGGEPMPVIGQPEGREPALRLETDGEEMLQPFDSIKLMDGETDNG